MYLRIAALAVLLLVCSDSLARTQQFYSGNKLKGMLDDWVTSNTNNSNILSAGIGFGYVIAVHDTNSNVLCTPQGVTAGQLIDVVVKYLREHPAELHKDADTLTFLAFMQAWPCPKVEGTPRPTPRPTPTPKPAPTTQPSNPF